eukprot:668276-Pleurochrysis_carterae.AAC.11
MAYAARAQVRFASALRRVTCCLEKRRSPRASTGTVMASSIGAAAKGRMPTFSVSAIRCWRGFKIYMARGGLGSLRKRYADYAAHGRLAITDDEACTSLFLPVRNGQGIGIAVSFDCHLYFSVEIERTGAMLHA